MLHTHSAKGERRSCGYVAEHTKPPHLITTSTCQKIGMCRRLPMGFKDWRRPRGTRGYVSGERVGGRTVESRNIPSSIFPQCRSGRILAVGWCGYARYGSGCGACTKSLPATAWLLASVMKKG